MLVNNYVLERFQYSRDNGRRMRNYRICSVRFAGMPVDLNGKPLMDPAADAPQPRQAHG